MKKIIVIDDDVQFLEEMQILLTSKGYDVKVLSDGAFAAVEVCRFKPDAVLLDLKMSGESGFEIAGELRQNAETSKIPIIGITGFYTEKEHSLFIQMCGIKRWLIKPIKQKDLFESLEDAWTAK